MTCTRNNSVKDISLFELLLLTIITVSTVGVVLLMLNRFNSLHALIPGVTLALLTVAALKLQISFDLRQIDYRLLIILFLALFFRAEPYLWVMGGQDQGVYVNMSAHYEQTGSSFVKDRMREMVPPEQRLEYDRSQILFKKIALPAEELQVPYPKEFSKDHNRFYVGMYLPGVYLKNVPNSEYVFQFYPLHPIWMSIFGKLLGSDNRVYSIVFFSLLNIVTFYLLAQELSGSRVTASICAAFLALNPLHAFFAKFPVSETAGLFFTTAGILFLFRYYISLEQGDSNPLNAILAGGSFFCLFMTHITGFLYLSLLTAALVYLLLTEAATVRKNLYRGYIALVALFGVSVCYGCIYSFPYFYEIFSVMFRSRLGSNWAGIMLAAVVAVQLLLYLLMRMHRTVAIDERKLRLFLYAVLFLIVTMASYKIYQIGFTARYVGHWEYDRIYKTAGEPLRALVKSNLFVYLKYATPIAFIAMLFALADNRIAKRNGTYFIFAFVLFFAFFRLVASSTTPYQYYYARYLFAEIIPFTLLIGALMLGAMYESGRKWQRMVSIVSVLIIAVYFGVISSLQLKGKEGDGAAAALSKIVSNLDENKLLIYKLENGKGFEYPDSQIITPLLYYYGANMLFIKSMDDLNGDMFKSILNRFGTAYVMSKESVASDKLSFVDSIAYKHGMFEGTSGIPNTFGYTRFNLNLYRINLQ